MGLPVSRDQALQRIGTAKGRDLEVPSKEQAAAAFSFFSYADGFMAAVACGPEFISPSEWLPQVLASLGPDMNTEEYCLLAETMLGGYNCLLEDLNGPEDVYQPLFGKDDDGGLSTHDWAAGFIEATHLRETHWASLREKQDGKLIFVFLAVLLRDDQVDAGLLENGIDPRELFTEAYEEIPGLVYALHSLRLEMPAEPDVPRASIAKVGRNDPCPCGSGKKYKKCCLN